MRLSVLALIGSSLVAASAIAASGPAPQSLRTPESFAGIAEPAQRSLAIYAEMSRVIQNPRCLNCHPATRAPLQRNGLAHNPPIAEASQSRALECQTCHHQHNTPTFAGGIDSIPGAPHWRLAPPEMAWVGKTSGQICRQLKDRSRNGNRDLAALQTHMAKDELVGWGWHPGIGRTPAPGTQAQFGELAAAWIASGAACPTT